MNDSREQPTASKSSVVLAKTPQDAEQHVGAQGANSASETAAAASVPIATEVNGVDKAERNWAVAAHLSSLSLYLGIPFGDLLGPLIVWLIKKGESPFTEAHAKESLNFQISLLIYAAVSFLLLFFLVGFLLLPALIVLHVVLSIVAAIKASEGKLYRYPLTIRFIS